MDRHVTCDWKQEILLTLIHKQHKLTYVNHCTCVFNDILYFKTSTGRVFQKACLDRNSFLAIPTKFKLHRVVASVRNIKNHYDYD